MRKIILLAFIVLHSVIFSQIEEANRRFDSVYFDVATNVAGKDIQRAIKIADSLYKFSPSKEHQIKSLMLSSSLYQNTGALERTILLAEKAETLASETKNYSWLARISGLLSTVYRNIGLYEKGKKYLEKGIKAGSKTAEGNGKNSFLGMVYQEKALYALEQEDVEEGLKSLKKAEGYFEKLQNEKERKYFRVVNFQIAGRAFLLGGDYNKAIENFQQAITLSEGVIEDKALVMGFVNTGLGSSYLNTQNYEQAKKHIDKAMVIADTSADIMLNIDLYELVADYYKKKGDLKNSIIYQEKYRKAKAQQNADQKAIIDKLVKLLEKDNQTLSQSTSRMSYIMVIVIVLSLGFMFFYYQKGRRDLQKFRAIIAELSAENTPVVIKKAEGQVTTSEPKSKKSIVISDKKEKEIIEGLQDFEQRMSYLDGNISLSVLAGGIGTNTIYLSHVLNRYYKKDFNLYINELRIRYIVQKLKNNKEYRQYKISYLAEECGFSSHSKFSSVFKSITGFTPSVFIGHIEKEENS